MHNERRRDENKKAKTPATTTTYLPRYGASNDEQESLHDADADDYDAALTFNNAEF